MFIGFIVVLLGVLTESATTALTVLFTAPYLAAVLAVCFVNASNNTVKNVGYALGALLGVYGFVVIITDNLVVSACGMVFMLFAALGYAVTYVLKFFGWVKGEKEISGGVDISSQLGKYKEMEKENIITDEEFVQLKGQALQSIGDNNRLTFEDLKKWKKLLDQQVLTEEEFSQLKSKIFNK